MSAKSDQEWVDLFRSQWATQAALWSAAIAKGKASHSGPASKQGGGEDIVQLGKKRYTVADVSAATFSIPTAVELAQDMGFSSDDICAAICQLIVN